MHIQSRYCGCGFHTMTNHHEGKHEYPEHLHHFIETVCVLDGEIEITINGNAEIARKGDIAVIPPFHPHSFHTPQYCKIWVELFSPVWVTDFFSWEKFYMAEKNVFTPQPQTFSYIVSKMPPQRYSWRRKEDELSKDFFRRTKTLYYAIFEEYFTNVKISFTELNTSAVSATYTYVNEHYLENLTLKKVAAAIGYTSNYISYCLSVIPNSSFRTILNSARVEHAKKLLVSTDMRIVDVALDSGFASEAVFYGIFEKFTGMTPKKYRLYKRGVLVE